VKASALVATAVSLLASCGCESQPAVPQQTTVAAAAAPAKPVVTTAQLEFSDLEMRRSSKFSINGDLRPFYRVSGRIQNNSPYTVTAVRFFVQVWTANGKQDSAVLNLKTNILPSEAQTFMQDIQLLPPPGKWNWQYEALSVEAEN
jgi:hypothetical protein